MKTELEAMKASLPAASDALNAQKARDQAAAQARINAQRKADKALAEEEAMQRFTSMIRRILTWIAFAIIAYGIYQFWG